MSNQDIGTPEITCPGCNRTFPEKTLVLTETRHCPHCHALVETVGGFPSPRADMDAQVILDISVISAWLDNHKKASGMAFAERSKSSLDKAFWAVESDKKPWKFEVGYPSHQGLPIVALRLISKSDADVNDVSNFSKKIKAVSGKHGLDPYCVHNWQRCPDDDTGDKGESNCLVWGVSQYISLTSLSEDLFVPILDRLAKAMEDALMQGVK